MLSESLEYSPMQELRQFQTAMNTKSLELVNKAFTSTDKELNLLSLGCPYCHGVGSVTVHSCRNANCFCSGNCKEVLPCPNCNKNGEHSPV